MAKLPSLSSSITRYGLFGIMSISYEDCMAEQGSLPSIFTSARNYLSWIQSAALDDCYLSDKSGSASGNCDDYREIKPFSVTDDLQTVVMEFKVPDCHATNTSFLEDFQPFFANFEDNLVLTDLRKLNESCAKSDKEARAQETQWRMRLDLHTAYNIAAYWRAFGLGKL